MGVHMLAEGTIVSRGPVPIRPRWLRYERRGTRDVDDIRESASAKSSDYQCNPWRWYKGVVEVHINKGGVGEDRGG
jgi:hypothetical protein